MVLRTEDFELTWIRLGLLGMALLAKNQTRTRRMTSPYSIHNATLQTYHKYANKRTNHMKWMLKISNNGFS